MGEDDYPKLSLRVPPELLERLDAVAQHLAKVRALPGMVRVSRSAAARAALEVGLDALERAHGKGKGKR